jgi:UDP-N-acetylmuramoyl-L-alanyl-D-glutamate--2,6-diaminopimelate ligase
VAGIDFQIGLLTNITHEHLDYHGNMQNYIDAKLKLFRNTKFAVINKDYGYIKNQIAKSKIIEYSKYYKKINNPNLSGEYNSYNVSAAEAVAKILDVRSQIVDKVIKNFKGVEGRRQEVKNNKGIKVFVDFAHTPNALQEVLTQERTEISPL